MHGYLCTALHCRPLLLPTVWSWSCLWLVAWPLAFKEKSTSHMYYDYLIIFFLSFFSFYHFKSRENSFPLFHFGSNSSSSSSSTSGVCNNNHQSVPKRTGQDRTEYKKEMPLRVVMVHSSFGLKFSPRAPPLPAARGGGEDQD